MRFTPEQWHARFQQQASWTRQARQYLLQRVGLSAMGRVLEVGCGTGAVLVELAQSCGGRLHGLDIRPEHLRLALSGVPGAFLVQGDAHCLPYAAGSFEATCCHFLLLWVRNPSGVVSEMKRVTQPGGAVLLLAEPDYSGRIDHPPALAMLGEWQRQALRRAGAKPDIGRELAGLLSQSGVEQIEWGVLGGSWSDPPEEQDWEMEWQVLRADLEQMPTLPPDETARLDALQELDRHAWGRRERVLFVPTFYAWGRVRA